MSSFKMPYSNFHELNLDWMLEEFKKFADTMDEKIATFDEFQEAWIAFQREISETLDTYEAAMEAYKTFINGQISNFESGMTEDFNDFKSEMQDQYDEFIEDYLQSLGIVQETGQSTELVMSQKAVSDIVDTHETRLDDAESAIDIIEEEIDSMSDNIDTIETDVATLIPEVETIDSNVETLTSRVSVLELNDASTRGRVASLESRASQTDIDINGLDSRITATENDISSLKSRTTSLETDNTSNKSRIEELETELPLVKNRVSDLETDNTSNKARITTLENKTATIENDIEDLVDQIDNLETDNTSNKARISDLETDNTSNKSRITSLEGNSLVFEEITDFIYNGENLTTKFASEISEFQNEWEWIKNRIQNGRFSGIHVNDYIPFTTTDNVALNACVGGINTYKGYGDAVVNNHIDFICRELWQTGKPINPANYNNGLIPVETINGDGETTEFILTKEMNDVASVKQNDIELTGWTYDSSTFTLTFEEAPAANAITVTGAGSEYPWLASDLYLWLNSLTGQVPNGTGVNPAVIHKDYTQDGVYYYLPASLKNVIVEKRAYLPKRYSATELISDDNGGGWENIGKLWLPSECEVYGAPCWGGKGGYSTTGNNIQYPTFAHNMNRLKRRGGSRGSWWVLSVYSGNTTVWCLVGSSSLAYYAGASNTGVTVPVCFRIS